MEYGKWQAPAGYKRIDSSENIKGDSGMLRPFDFKYRNASVKDSYGICVSKVITLSLPPFPYGIP